MKQMFDISEKLVSEKSDEIYGVKTIDWEDSSWKYLSLIRDEQVISLQRTKIYVFSDSVLCLGKIPENTHSNTAWEDGLTWFKSSPEYRNLDRIGGEPIEFEWKNFPGFTTLHRLQSSRFTIEIGWNTMEFFRTTCSRSKFNDISSGSKDNKKECESNAQLVSIFAKRFGAGQWSFLGLGSEKKWCSISEDSPQGERDKMAE